MSAYSLKTNQTRKSRPAFSEECFAQLSACAHPMSYCHLFSPSNCFSSLLLPQAAHEEASEQMQSNAVALSVCALQNVSIHLVCIMYFLLLFSRPLDSPTQSILRCLLAEYLGDAQLNKSLTKVCGAMLSASYYPNDVGVFSYYFVFHNLLRFWSCARVIMGIKSYLKERSCFIRMK